MRPSIRLLAVGAAAALALTGCGSSDDPGSGRSTEAGTETGSEPGDAATSEATGDDTGGSDAPVTIGGFNFPESTILMEIYAQSLEDAGIPVQREADLGTRELVFPELTGGNIDILPEYVGSAISVGFGEDPATEVGAAVDQLTELFAEDDVVVLEPSDAQDQNVFVVTSQFAEENGVASLADLADLGELTLAGGPECEDRQTCFAGLQEVYGLDNVSFTTIQEKSPRLAALQNGDVEIILLFSTDPVFTDGSLVPLEDPEGLTPPENVVPVVTREALDNHPDIEPILNEVSATLTTEGLAELNGQAAQGQQPADIAAGWLEENGLIGS